jgi:hypothetical protein
MIMIPRVIHLFEEEGKLEEVDKCSAASLKTFIKT